METNRFVKIEVKHNEIENMKIHVLLLFLGWVKKIGSEILEDRFVK